MLQAARRQAQDGAAPRALAYRLGQAEALDRIIRRYPDLTDDAFVAANRERWLA